MLFSSWQFIFLFLPITLVVFLALSEKPLWVRKIWLIVASLFFYVYWRAEYLPLLGLSILFNYSIAEIIARHQGRRAADVTCTVGVVVNLLALGYYKYANFFAQSLAHMAGKEIPAFDIVLPLAISFFTFTQISYIVDVHRNQNLHYRFLDYVLFVVFFPHLIAGPIVRHWEIIPQFATRLMRVTSSDASVGLAMFLMGLCKKVFFADNLSHYVNTVYDAANRGVTIPWFDAWFATLAFAVQIYFDFSGYSDMAIGLARMFGIKFPVNFNSPYQAASINEFWTRWHITLTRFLREYVYFPLGGNRVGPVRHALNIMITMLLSGLWHGAGWTYVIWGGLHGVYLIIAHRWERLAGKSVALRHWAYRTVSVCATFVAVLWAWVFFRAASLSGAKNLLMSMVGINGWTMSTETTNPTRNPGVLFSHLGIHFVPAAFRTEGYDPIIKLLILTLVIIFFAPNTQQLLESYEPALEKIRPGWIRLKLGWMTGMVLGALFFFVFRTFFTTVPSPFVYFNF